MEYKVGDKVRVRSDLVAGKTYYMEDREHRDSVVPEMIDLCGKIVAIRKITEKGKYQIEEDYWTWTDEMFEGLVETEFHVYDTVKHEKYGLGTVIKIAGNIVVVDFDEKPFDRPALINNVLYCSKRELTIVQAYIGGEDE